ncbi:hypothetical protein UN64_19525 [Fictibacillus arsenicus]|uniref:Uncharacterized protein n=1 Tax=Fictibacillus arsenicus TaxID=255247 RepID=A0A1V3G0P1_9BACL|nr:hypothetical protein UN64_19525 [Fictibacillus arsenicus]
MGFSFECSGDGGHGRAGVALQVALLAVGVVIALMELVSLAVAGSARGALCAHMQFQHRPERVHESGHGGA